MGEGKSKQKRYTKERDIESCGKNINSIFPFSLPPAQFLGV
jgi:hypothetical protein